MSWPRDLRGGSNLGHNMAQAGNAPIWDRLVRARKRKKELGLYYLVLGDFICQCMRQRQLKAKAKFVKVMFFVFFT